MVPSLVHAASGLVLELGPGPGNQIHRFGTAGVTFIYGVEPNSLFKEGIDAKLRKHGLSVNYKLILCGVEDSDVLRDEGISEGSLDAVLCIQVLCAVKDPKSVMKDLWKLLKPGGRFIFWEHGESRDRLTGTVQGMRLPISGEHGLRNEDKDRLIYISTHKSRLEHICRMSLNPEGKGRYSAQWRVGESRRYRGTRRAG